MAGVLTNDPLKSPGAWVLICFALNRPVDCGIAPVGGVAEAGVPNCNPVVPGVPNIAPVEGVDEAGVPNCNPVALGVPNTAPAVGVLNAGVVILELVAAGVPKASPPGVLVRAEPKLKPGVVVLGTAPPLKLNPEAVFHKDK